MAERAHPDDPGFQDRWIFRRKWGVVPCWRKWRSPYRSAFQWRYEWVSRYCVGKDVLDVPCGMGWGTSCIRSAKSLIGIDLSDEAVEEARRRYGAIARFEVGDMANICLPDSSVDVVCCLEGIEHVPVAVGRRFLADAKRVLRAGGRLLISSPFCRTKTHSGNQFHIHEYQPAEITAMLKEHFFVEEQVSRDVDIMTVLYINCRKAD